MWNKRELLTAIFLILLGASARAQTREVLGSGTYVIDASGRYVALEGTDGVVVTYLYDDARTETTSGVAVRVNDKITLTVRFQGEGAVSIAGLPALTSSYDDEGRTVAVHADGKPIALFEYGPTGLFAAASLPGKLAWTVSAPDPAEHVRQSITGPTGRVVARSVITNVHDVQNRAWYDAVLSERGVGEASVTYDVSPTGSLTTARDSEGRIVFYLVHTDSADVGFLPDGKPFFYDLRLTVFGGFMPPESDLLISHAWEAQAGAIPDHLVLTAAGAAELYTESASRSSVVTAWANAEGKMSVVTWDDEIRTGASSQ